MNAKGIVRVGIVVAIVTGCSQFGGRPANSPTSITAEATTGPVSPKATSLDTVSPRSSPPSAQIDETAATPAPSHNCTPSDLAPLNPGYDIHAPQAAAYPAVRDVGTVVDSFSAIDGVGFNPRVPAAEPTDKRLQLLIVDTAGEAMETAGFRAYYAEAALSDEATIASVLIDGGVMLHEYGSIGGGDYDSISERAGKTITGVAIGQYTAALLWAAPLDNDGHRYFILRWSDGHVDFEVLAGLTDPNDVVDFARSMYCGSSTMATVTRRSRSVVLAGSCHRATQGDPPGLTSGRSRASKA